MDNVLTLLDVGLLDHFLHDRQHLLHRHTIGQFEVYNTHCRIHIFTQMILPRQICRIHHKQTSILTSQNTLRLTRQLSFHFLQCRCTCVQEENAIILQCREHVELVEIGALAAGDIVSTSDVVRTVNRILAISKIVHRPSIRFLRLILRVSLDIQLMVITQDLHDSLRH